MCVCVSFSFLRCEEHNTVKERKSLQCVFYMSLCECVYMYVAGCVCACVCVRVCVCVCVCVQQEHKSGSVSESVSRPCSPLKL